MLNKEGNLEDWTDGLEVKSHLAQAPGLLPTTHMGADWDL